MWCVPATANCLQGAQHDGVRLLRIMGVCAPASGLKGRRLAHHLKWGACCTTVSSAAELQVGWEAYQATNWHQAYLAAHQPGDKTLQAYVCMCVAAVFIASKYLFDMTVVVCTLCQTIGVCFKFCLSCC